MTAPSISRLVVDLRDALKRVGDPQRAGRQQAYMKSALPYYGVTTPDVRRIVRANMRHHPVVDASAWQSDILALWQGASHRELRYAAIELLLAPGCRRFLTPRRLPLVEHLIVDGAWWDYVDPIATQAVGGLLRDYREWAGPLLRRWARDDDLWRRRAAILAQLKFKNATDETLLVDVITPSLASDEFFLRKAIGWALREYSKTEPQFVIEFVQGNEVAPLTEREALKALRKRGAVE